MPPENERDRPRAKGGLQDEQHGGGYVASSLRDAFELLADSAERERRIDRAAFAEGYRLGFAAGHEVGESRVQSAALLAHDDIAAEVVGRVTSRSHAELERVRWGGRREDFGRPRLGDHPGGPKDWNGRVGRGRGTAA